MALKDFFTEIYNYEYEIPVSVKIFIIALIIEGYQRFNNK